MVTLLTDLLKIERHDVFRAYVNAKTTAFAKTFVHDNPCCHEINPLKTTRSGSAWCEPLLKPG
jgi:hypothetical protein